MSSLEHELLEKFRQFNEEDQRRVVQFVKQLMNKKAPLTPEHMKHFIAFMGYGRVDAPIWFLGMEESMGGSRDTAEALSQAVDDNIRARLTFDSVMDMGEAMFKLGWDFEKETKSPTRVWTWMAYLAIEIEKPEGIADKVDYVRKHLGRKNGSTFLTELLPLPAVGLRHWPAQYQVLYPNRKAYFHAVWEQRKTFLKQLFHDHPPRYLFAYGTTYRKYYKAVIGDIDWKPLENTRGIEVGKTGNTIAVIMPFLGGQNGLRKAEAQLMLSHIQSM